MPFTRRTACEGFEVENQSSVRGDGGCSSPDPTHSRRDPTTIARNRASPFVLFASFVVPSFAMNVTGPHAALSPSSGWQVGPPLRNHPLPDAACIAASNSWTLNGRGRWGTTIRSHDQEFDNRRHSRYDSPVADRRRYLASERTLRETNNAVHAQDGLRGV